MSEFKYVIVRSGMHDYPIIFPDKINHDDMAKCVKAIVPAAFDPKNRNRVLEPKVVAAGFLSDLGVTMDRDRKSETLGIGPRAYDGQLINSYPYTHGIKDLFS